MPTQGLASPASSSYLRAVGRVRVRARARARVRLWIRVTVRVRVRVRVRARARATVRVRVRARVRGGGGTTSRRSPEAARPGTPWCWVDPSLLLVWWVCGVVWALVARVWGEGGARR